MNVTEARERLERMLAQDVTEDPALVLDAATITDLLRLSAVADPVGVQPFTQRDAWDNNHDYAAGDTVRATGDSTGLYYTATVAGESGPTEPTWPLEAGQTVVDGTVTWTTAVDAWDPTWELDRGAAEGWLRKAGRVAQRYDFAQAEGERHQRSQMYAHCIEQHERYRRRIISGVHIGAAVPYSAARVVA